jgi:hypothetical protein
MSAGRDVERLIATWLVEESPGRAPDRILEGAAQTIDRTKQRRFGAAWREPVSISMRGLAAMAAVLILAVIAAGWIGRSTAGVGAAPTPALSTSPTPPASDGAPSVAAYQRAFAAVCASLAPVADAPPSAAPAELGAFLQATIARGNNEVAGFEAIQAPPVVLADHLANIQTTKDVLVLLSHEADLVAAGKLDEANTVDEATGPLNALREQFAVKWGLSTDCP